MQTVLTVGGTIFWVHVKRATDISESHVHGETQDRHTRGSVGALRVPAVLKRVSVCAWHTLVYALE